MLKERLASRLLESKVEERTGANFDWLQTTTVNNTTEAVAASHCQETARGIPCSIDGVDGNSRCSSLAEGRRGTQPLN